MKKILFLSAIAVMVFSLFLISACDDEAAAPDSPDNGEPVEGNGPEYILVGVPNSETGPLADFGAVTPWSEQRVVDYVNEQGGIYIEEYDRQIPIRLITVDTESSPDRASAVTTRLILDEGVDIVMSAHTPVNTVPVSQTCERYEVPHVSMSAPVLSWLSGGPYTWAYHAFFTGEQVVDVYEGMWQDTIDEYNIVGLAMPDDPDGTLYSEEFLNILPERGYEVVDAGRFPSGMDDYSALIREYRAEGVNILAGVQTTPDFITLWRQAVSEGFVPPISTHGKPILLPSNVEALGGNLAHGLTTVIWWHEDFPFESALTGETPQDLVAAWEEETGTQINVSAGFNYAGMEIVVDALTRAASLDKDKIREALGETNLETMAGPIEYNEQHYCQTPLVGGQWVPGEEWPWELNIVYNTEVPGLDEEEMILITPELYE